MSAPEATSALFLCDGADPSGLFAGLDWDQVERLTSTAEDGESNLQLDSLVSRLGHQVTPIAEDLIYIATYCVAADQLTNRGSKALDVHRRKWRRRLMLAIPVSDPGFWNKPTVTRPLEQALHVATEDTWSFAFTQRPPAEHLQLRINELDNRAMVGDPDSIVLFSGGTDSLCALVEAIGTHNLRPIAVSHRSANQIHKWQVDLLEGVRTTFPSWQIPHMSFTMHRRGGGDSDPSQRTRPFLFAALGTAIAASLGIDLVLLADNGYVSVNPKISAELAGALASRGTHPTLLRLLSRLNAAIFDTPIRIENPLALKTRAEALSVLSDHHCAHLLALTHTCGKHRARPRHQPHCGYCSQCVDRRFASLAAGLAAADPVATYGVDVFAGSLPPDGEARKIPLLYRQFARETQDLGDDEMVAQYPEILECIDPEQPLSLAGVVDVLRRHAREVLQVMEEQIVVHKRALAQGTLPATCLLRLDSGERAFAETPPSDKIADDADRNVIELTPYICRFTFGGEKGEVPALTGVKQLIRLLTALHQDLKAMDLAYHTLPPTKARPDLLEGGLVESHETEPAIDDTARRDYLRRAREIKESLDGDVEDQERDQLRSELEFIDAELKRVAGLGGRIRPLTSEQENARTLVRKNMTRALADIERELPPLRVHLRESLHLGHVCRYTPQPPIKWRIAS
jgi:7-cyano-7-deazaguanine synthase in queuosine biosynthesis